MRLGLTNSTYQYLFASPGGMFANRSDLAYSLLGQPHPYFTTRAVHRDPKEQLEYLIGRCVELGIPVLHAPIRVWDDTALVDRIKGLLTEHNLELMPSMSADLISGGQKTAVGVATAIGNIGHYARFGGVRVSKFCTTPMVHSRFTTDPPLEEQLLRITNNIEPIVKAAEDAGIVLAFENHLDYRAREIVQVIEAVDSPNLRFLFDTGNTLTVCEDPVDAAYDAAPYTALVHLKDVRVHPWTPGREFVSVMYAAPLGRGHVNNRKIVEIMRDRAPNASQLCLSLEMMPLPPNEDEDLWVDESIAWAKKAFADLLD